MVKWIPAYGLRAYALFLSRHGTREPFGQSELDWIVSESMKKKVFSLLLNAGWIGKISRNKYVCMESKKIFQGLLQFKVQDAIRKSKKPYCFTGLSAIEIWSDYSYIQRGLEKSPYFIKVLSKDLGYWKRFFNFIGIPNYINKGSTIGEYVILLPVKFIKAVEKSRLKVETYNHTLNIAKKNEMYLYAYEYMRKKYGASAA